MSMFVLSQAMIFIFGTISMFLFARNDRWSKWAPIVGLLDKPFWFYATITTDEWGIFALNFVYMFIYLYGLYNFWIRERQ